MNGEFLRTPIEIARAYKTAGDALVEQAVLNFYPFELDYPIFFNYRHSLELYLKILTGFNIKSEKSHNLTKLISELESQYEAKLPDWMRARLEDFHKIDPGSISFRYAETITSNDTDQYLWVDLYQLRLVMGIMCEGFEKLIEK